MNRSRRSEVIAKARFYAGIVLENALEAGWEIDRHYETEDEVDLAVKTVLGIAERLREGRRA